MPVCAMQESRAYTLFTTFYTYKPACRCFCFGVVHRDVFVSLSGVNSFDIFCSLAASEA